MHSCAERPGGRSVTSNANAGRLDLVDSLRGFALLGLFLVHCIEYFELYWVNPLGGPVFDWVFGLFSGKSYALFALCFGLSFFLIMDSATQRCEDFRGRFAWRLVLLFGFGMIHALIYRGDILQILATFGLLMLLFDRVKSNRVLVALAAIAFLQLPLLLRAWAAANGAGWALAPALFGTNTSMPVMTDGSFAEVLGVNLIYGHIMTWSFYAETGRLTQIVGLFLAGLVLGRVGFFRQPERFTRLRRIGLCASGALALVLWFAGPALLDSVAAFDSPARPHLQWALACWTDLAILTFQVLLFILLFGTGARRILRLLAAPGRMTLTLYIAQSFVFVPVF
jgi:uncharacterized protein